jgi:four helix bundle protein
MDSEGEGRTQFEKLDVYRLSEKLADEVWTTVAAWDRFAKQTIGAQLVRSADSIGANIAEGAGRGSFQDIRRFVRTARGPLNETKHRLRRAHSRHLLRPDTVSRIKPLIDALAPKLNAYLRSIGPVPGQGQIESSSQRTTDNGPLMPSLHRTSSHCRTSRERSVGNGALTTDNGQRTTDNGRLTTDNGRRTTDYGQRTTDDGPRTPNDEQRTTDNGQRTTDNLQERKYPCQNYL